MGYVSFVVHLRTQIISSFLVIWLLLYEVVFDKALGFSGILKLSIIFGISFFCYLAKPGSLCGFSLQPKVGPFGLSATNSLLKEFSRHNLLTVSSKLASCYSNGDPYRSRVTWTNWTCWLPRWNASTATPTFQQLPHLSMLALLVLFSSYALVPSCYAAHVRPVDCKLSLL